MNSQKWVASRKLRAGDRVAVLSPAVAAPAMSEAVHEQAMKRLTETTGLIPVEYPTTRELGASAQARAVDIVNAFADPAIGAILATIGGNDQVTVISHLDAEVIAANPKPFVGYSDNTNLHNFLWSLGINSYYGGSTQVHLGSGPYVDEVHLSSLRAALIDGGTIGLTEPGESEDFGIEWTDPRALTHFGVREETEPWRWAGPQTVVEARTWGGCLDVIDQIAIAGRMPTISDLEGSIVLFETSEELNSAAQVKGWVRALGERGILAAAAGVLVARPPVSALGQPVPETAERARLRQDQYETIIEQVNAYNPDAVICAGIPFGHTRPQWIIPHGGVVCLDAITRTVTANYS
ncbi:S66 family peptidase [Corynebacterium alimapuense]|uniref:LD-carboxypeptidase n=1 Tax=Corynebacterium alimapuense TaxID=1576874 RepID=A0A3M8K7M8_9CORY|nr:S66 peptidase family protein [Corynebacterium alimapuense]RNE48514.1 LD-carboxypeptidase [Corynebacterium alimapuense]